MYVFIAHILWSLNYVGIIYLHTILIICIRTSSTHSIKTWGYHTIYFTRWSIWLIHHYMGTVIYTSPTEQLTRPGIEAFQLWYWKSDFVVLINFLYIQYVYISWVLFHTTTSWCQCIQILLNQSHITGTDALCDRACKNRSCECKLHQVIFSLISFIQNVVSQFCKLQKLLQ